MATERQLTYVFLKSHPREAARILERLPAASVIRLLESTPVAITAAVLAQLDVVLGAQVLAAIAPERAAAIVEALDAAAAAQQLRCLERPVRAAILAHCGARTATRLLASIQYPEDSIGALMDPVVFTVGVEERADQALKRVRQVREMTDDTIYAVNADRAYAGAVRLHALLRAAARTPVAALLDAQVPALPALAPWHEVLTYPAWRTQCRLPVVDAHTRLVGVLAHVELQRRQHARASAQRWHAADVALTFGELYWAGLSALTAVVTDVFGTLAAKGSPRVR